MNSSQVVPKTMIFKNWCWLICLLLLTGQGIGLSAQTALVDYPARINEIKHFTGHTPGEWMTYLSQYLLFRGSSQNRTSIATSPSVYYHQPAITSNYQLEGNQLKLVADFGRMLHTQIKVNDQAFTGKIEPAGFDTILTYSYADIDPSEMIICKWDIKGKTYLGKLESPAALAHWMNNCEPQGNWKLDHSNLLVEGTSSEVDCGTLEIISRNSLQGHKIDPVLMFPPRGTVLHLEEGTEYISFQEPGVEYLESLVLDEPVKSNKTAAKSVSQSSPVTTFVEQRNHRFLYIENLDKMPNHKLSIFNRWGREIYHAIQYQNNWNGKSQGSPIPEGTYYYVLDNGKGNTFTGCFNIGS